MTTYRLRNIGIAVALAVVAALLTTFYVTNYKKNVQRQQESVQVLVAAKDIPAGTLGSEVITSKMLVQREVARKAVVPGLITNTGIIKGQIVTQPIYQGEQLTAQRFGPVTQQGIRTQLKGTYRAFQVAGDSNQILAGTIHAGDTVDVVGVIKVKIGDNDYAFSRIVIRNVKVLKTSGASSTTSKITSPTGGDSWAILRVTDNQAQKLALAYKAGDYWAVALRPSLNDADSPGSVETTWTLLTDGLTKAQILRALGVDPATVSDILGGPK